MIQQYTRGVQRRLSVERSFEHASYERQGAGLSQWIPRAVRTDRPDSDLGSLFLQNEESPNSSRNGFWLGTFSYWGNQDEERREDWIDGGYTGFDVRSQGIILGYDHRLTNQSTLGLSVGYASADIDLYNNTGDGDINNKSVSVYGEYTVNQNYVNAILTYGESDYDNSRNLKIGSIERTAMSDHDGTSLSGALEVGKAIVHENTLFEPFASLHYIRLDEDGFEEKGAADANLILEGRKTESLVSQIGIRASNDIKQRHGRLTADVELAWVHDFGIDDRIITSSYVGSPQIVFPVEGRDIGQNGGSLNFGVSYHAKNALTVSARVGAEVRDGYRDAGVFGLLQYTF